MKVVKSLEEINLSGLMKGIGLTIGNFDGVHLGHQHFLKSIRDKFHASDLAFTVMTFVPHPKQILCPDQKNYLINNYHDRRELLASLGVEFLVEIDFTRDFSTLSAELFLRNFIVLNKDIKHLCIGHDFAFGQNKQGDHQFIKEYCLRSNIVFDVEDEFSVDGLTISSTVIRDVINGGMVETAMEYLGRPYFLSGVVVKGVGRGRQMGFSTANIKFHRELIYPKPGIYISRTMCEGMMYNSLTNVGFNPTFEHDQKIHVETHILDFDKFIYGEKLQIYFLKKIRDERKFDSVNGLIKQIRVDVDKAQKYFGEGE